jgi:aminoglycoside N3'-acetyltransferase
MVTKANITQSLKELGVKNGDVLLFHSSLTDKEFIKRYNSNKTFNAKVRDAIITIAKNYQWDIDCYEMKI